MEDIVLEYAKLPEFLKKEIISHDISEQDIDDMLMEKFPNNPEMRAKTKEKYMIVQKFLYMREIGGAKHIKLAFGVPGKKYF